MLDIIGLYQLAFGNRSYQKIDMQRSYTALEAVKNIAVYDENDPELKSIMGTPIFMPCKIDGYLLPNEPLITITGVQTIVKTKVTGLKGTVKELISQDDFRVVIKGIITNDVDDNYPAEEVEKLKAICKKQESLEIINKLTGIFEIPRIAIESYDVFGIEGHQSQQAYQINAISDRAVELIIREGL